MTRRIAKAPRRPSGIIAAFALGLALFAWLGAARAETDSDRPSLDSILVRFPARTAADRDALAAELMSLGRKTVADLCARLAPAGIADDSLARFALDALAVHAARPGAADERVAVAKALADSLKNASSAEVKAFIIAELQLLGGQESVNALTACLGDGRIAGPAARALGVIGSGSAERNLIKALGGAPPDIQVAIVQTLGRMRSRRAVAKILPLARDDDEELRMAALEALAQSGEPAAAAAFEWIPLLAPAAERTQTASLYLLYGRRLQENGDRKASEEICRGILKNYLQPTESPVRCQALSLLSDILGPAVLDDLLGAVDSADKDYRLRALDLAETLSHPKATSRWLDKWAQAQAEIKAEITAMLGRRRDPEALPAVREGLKDPDRSVRLAAMAALARLGGEETLPELLPFLSSGEPDETAIVKEALLSITAERAVSAAAGLLDGVPPVSQAALIEVLAERRARPHADRILGLIRSDSEEVSRAALVGLERIVRAEDLPRLLELLTKSADAAETAPLQNALAAAALQNPDPDRRADPIIKALVAATGSQRVDLIRILPRLGGTQALAAVRADIQNPDPLVRAVAVHSLSLWPSLDALEGLLSVLKQSEDRKLHYLAVQGLSRLSGDPGLAAADRSGLLKDVWAEAADPGEKKLVLQALSRSRSPESLTLAASALDDPELRELAAEAVVGIALPDSGAEGLGGMETALSLKKAAPLMRFESDLKRVEEYAAALLVREGFVPLFDGKTISGWKGLVGDPPSRAKMVPQELKKAQAAADDDMRRHWRVIDGCLVFDGQGHSLCTARDYADFELFVDWKIEPQGDSGIYLRGSPQVQIWDPARWPEGSGGLYNNQTHPSKPLRPADNPVETWNTFRILMKDDRVTVWLNGVLVVDGVVMENYWERDESIYAAGQIELQAHSTPLAFKNIFIRPIE